MHPFDYCASETVRQSGTMAEAIGMFSAWQYFAKFESNGLRLAEDDLITAVRTIKNDPSLNYRKVPAVFNQGVPAIPASSVPRAMSSLFYGLREVGVDTYHDASHWTVEFLLIHPFADGNGRVGSLMWNFLNGSIANPEPMPYFFGDK